MYDYSGLSYKHIDFFITIAECGTMSKAAESLHVSQPLLSQKISQLENSIGINLFYRSKQRIYLTDAGKQLLIDFKDIKSHLHYAIDSVRKEYCDNQPITIGFSNGQKSSITKAIIRELQLTFPNRNFAAEVEPLEQLRLSLLNGKIDIVFTMDIWELCHNKEIHSRTVYMAPLYCIVNTSMPISNKKTLKWKDLEGYTCIVPDHLKNGSTIHELNRKFNQEGVNISFQYRAGDILTILRYVTINDCITLSGYQNYEDDKLKWFAMEDVEYPNIVAWKKKDDGMVSSYAEKLVDIIRINRPAI